MHVSTTTLLTLNSEKHSEITTQEVGDLEIEEEEDAKATERGRRAKTRSKGARLKAFYSKPPIYVPFVLVYVAVAFAIFCRAKA
jgi:hypothetical protein